MRRSHRFLVKKLVKYQKEEGVALIVVLALLVLLTGVVVAYLSRSNTELKVSTASMSSTRADILTRSATEAIIAEIQKDIISGSNLDGGVYVPKSTGDMVFNRRLVKDDGAASVALEAAFPNLVRISRQATAQAAANLMISPGSSVASTADSLNMRSISAKRWNSHYLLPPAVLPGNDGDVVDPTPATIGATPFPVPYWVMVTSDGPSWISTLDQNTAKKVIGRYAFAIYNEGGLLDANVAGYPAVSASSATGKSSEAYADLTQLPLRNNSTLTQAMIDNLVGWRNKGLTNAVGNFGANYSFAVASGGREAFQDEFVLWEKSGYTKVKFPGDQRFLSRQALIKYWQRAGLKMEALQYLTTFSRALEQPSLLANSATIPGWNQATNPSVLKLKDASGNPFILKRFSLRRLAWLTPNGPSNSASGGVFLKALKDAGFTDDEINSGTVANISRYFGLAWANGGWTYSGDHIRTLAEVQSTNQEPNFFELLKAAIPEGALRMGAAAAAQSEAYNVHQQALDENLDRTIFQIGANIIDQYDADSYPTRITFTPAGSSDITVVGVESLPYIYGTRQGLVMTQYPQSSVAISGTAAPAPTPGSVTVKGTAVSMLFPILWNPHYENPAIIPASGLVPKVRFVASSDYPDILGGGSTNSLMIESESSGGQLEAGTGFVLKGNDDTALDINYIPGSFKNPMMIWDATSAPVVAGGSNNQINKLGGDKGFLKTDPLSNATTDVVGVVLGTAPLQWEVASSSGGSGSSTEVHTATKVNITVPAGTPKTDGAITMRMEYEAVGGGGWVTYDEKFAPVLGSVKISDWSDWKKEILSTDNINWSVAIDPRPSLFGMYSKRGTSAPFDASKPTPLAVDLGDTSYLGRHGWHGGSLFPWKLAVNTGAAGIADRDGIVRSGMAGRVPESDLAKNPMALATGSATSPQDMARPTVLNRPFRSVGELGYVFSGMPWRNLDQSSHLSGFSRLLDVFCLNDVDISGAPLVNGKVDLNTRQAPVLQAILAGAIKDEIGATTLDAPVAKKIAEALVAWTKDATTGAGATAGPLIERSDLVSRYDSARTTKNWGFTTKVATEMGADANFARLQEASVRGLANNGQTRVWNLMVDLVAQSGRYGTTQTDLAKFTVEGERRVWVHLAIDRFTGKVLDKQVEIVTE